MRKKTILMDYCLLTLSIRHRRKKRFSSKNMNDQVTKPIMMYNKPLTVNINPENETIYKIDQELDKVEYIKESSEGIRKVRTIINNTELVMFCDSDDLAYESFVQGGFLLQQTLHRTVQRNCMNSLKPINTCKSLKKRWTLKD